MKLLRELLESKWDYPGGMKGKGAATKEPGGKGQKGSKNRKARKAFRKAEKAKAHAARMRGEVTEGVSKAVQSIKELKVKKAGLRADYEAAVAEIDDQIKAIRSKRGQKLKDPDWSGYKEPGRTRDDGPRGAMG